MTRLKLSPRLRAVYEELLHGRSEKEIARKLVRSPHTIHNAVKRIYHAAGVASRPELLAARIAELEREAEALRLAAQSSSSTPTILASSQAPA